MRSKANCPSCGHEITWLQPTRAFNPFNFKCPNCLRRLPDEESRIQTPFWAIIAVGASIGAVFGYLQWHYGLLGIVFGIFILLLWFAVEASNTLTTIAAPNIEPQKLSGIRGWLLAYCILTMVISPVSTAHNIFKLVLAASHAGELNSKQIALMTSIATVSILLNIFAIYAGLSLIKRNKDAIKITKAYLICLLFCSVAIALSPTFLYSTQVIPTLIKENAKFFSQKVIFFFTWFLYFSRSRRVKATFGIQEIEHSTAGDSGLR